MKKFIVLYMAPMTEMDEWMKKPAEERKEAEEQMQSEWNVWMQKNASMMSAMTAGVGKTIKVTKDGFTDYRNDIMLYSVVEAESPEAVAEAFTDHPHLGIPNAWIEISAINPLPGMEGR